ncbi:MAG: Fe-S-containing hydro-lyase [Eubacterium sp.]|nr:Fe-S-containing hydro-lyase [Eubacterium sp.]
MDRKLTIPATDEEIKELRAGDMLYITGTIYTARDAAHKRMFDTLNEGGELPYDIEGSFVYYLGPTPAKPGQVIGSAGPTTSSRMDKYTPLLLSKGLKGMIGKGKRSPEVVDAIVKNGAIYCAAIGGLGALLSKRITKSEVIAYDDLGTEAIRKLTVEDLPVVVIIDTEGNNLYETAAADFLKTI